MMYVIQKQVGPCYPKGLQSYQKWSCPLHNFLQNRRVVARYRQCHLTPLQPTGRRGANHRSWHSLRPFARLQCTRELSWIFGRPEKNQKKYVKIIVLYLKLFTVISFFYRDFDLQKKTCHDFVYIFAESKKWCKSSLLAQPTPVRKTSMFVLANQVGYLEALKQQINSWFFV